MQDASTVEVLEARDDLSEVISDFWFRERVPRFPNVGQGLQRVQRVSCRVTNTRARKHSMLLQRE